MDIANKIIDLLSFRAFFPIGLRGFTLYFNLYVHVFIDFLGYFVEILGCDTGYSLCELFSVNSSLVVHEIVGD